MNILETSVANINKIIGVDIDIKSMPNQKGRVLKIELGGYGGQAKVRYIVEEQFVYEEWFYLDELKF